MAGEETHGFDLVLEVAEETVSDIVANVFSDENLSCAVVDALSAGVASDLGDCTDFVLTINFDRPNVPLPAGAANPVDILLETGDANAGTRTRMVVGFDVAAADIAEGEFDTIRLNFRDELYFAESTLRVLGAEQPFPGDEAAALRDALPPVVVLAIPVDRAATDPAKVRSADVFVVDDAPATDRDALAVGLTAAGGTAGDPSAFVRSFVPDGSDAALGISSAWLCRVLDPKIAAALGIDAGLVQDCRLTEPVEVTIEGETVELTELSLTVGDGEITLAAAVRQSGFCYEATGRISARITIGVQNGELVVTPDVGEPDVDVDVPWLCWVAGIALIIAGIGIALVSVVVGVIVAIVGALILVALFILQAVVGSAIGTVADAISAALEEALGGAEGLNVPIADLDFDLVESFVDDVTLGFQVGIRSSAGVRGEGDLYVPNDHAVDLDTGAVGPMGLAGADLTWTGTARARALHTACAAELARTAVTRIDDLNPYRLRLLDYSAPVTVAFAELFQVIEIDLPFIDWSVTWPTFRAFGVRTTGDRFAAVQAVALTDEYVVLRYRTFERAGPSVTINGDFGCRWPRVVPLDPAVGMVAAPQHALARRSVPGRAGLRTVAAVPPVVVPDEILRRPDIVAKLPPGLVAPPPVDNWIGPPAERRRRATFRATSTGLVGPLSHAWVLDGHAIGEEPGRVDVDGGSVRFEGGGTRAVRLRVDPDGAAMDLQLEVTVTDAEGTVVRGARCVHWTSTCWRPLRGVPQLGAFGAAIRKRGALAVVELAGAPG
jgi:hypothetical protein